MDLVTPAQRWATQDAQHQHYDRHHHQIESADPAGAHAHDRMPLVQHVTMFLSVFVPIIALIAAIVLLWHRRGWGLGWPEIALMVGMYALTGLGREN